MESQSLAEPQIAPTVPTLSGFDPPSVEDLAGRFPQLEVLELLGKGGMGAVYKARQKELDRLVAVKILPPEVAHDPAFAERFTREARALARLSHPNIVTVHDFGRTSAPPLTGSTEVPAAGAEGPLFYFIMEYVDGVNLRQAIQSGGISPREALAIVPQICDALQFAHDGGIVHRDIKPENILVDQRGRVKIADFGLAKLLGHTPGDVSLTGSQQVMGTLRYMAPEQLEGTKDVDHRADIYSLGVVFYELLTGELPIGRFAPPSKKVEIDVRLDDVVLRALEKEPGQRYQHVSEVKTEVDAIRDSAPAVSGLRPEGKPVVWERAQAGPWTALRCYVMLAAWTAVVVGACVYALPKAMMEWWPWAYDERWKLELKPQSGAYPKITLGGERRLYCWGQCGADPERMISRKPWTVVGKIEVASSRTFAALSLDAFREQWSWISPAGDVWRSQDEVQPESVVQGMKDAGIDIGKPGVREEAAALVDLLKDAANGVLPGNKRPRDYGSMSHDAKIGPFTHDGLSGWGLHPLGMVGLPLDMDRNQVGRRWVTAVVFLAIWLPGLRFLARRRRLPAGARRERKPERRYPYASEANTDMEAIRNGSREREPAEIGRRNEASSCGCAMAARVLTAMGAVTVASGVVTFLLLVGAIVDTYSFDSSFRNDVVVIPLLVLQTLAIPVGLLLVIGGLSTPHQGSSWPRCGAWLGLVPLTPAWLITLPLGIWTLTVLRRCEVLHARPRS